MSIKFSFSMNRLDTEKHSHLEDSPFFFINSVGIKQIKEFYNCLNVGVHHLRTIHISVGLEQAKITKLFNIVQNL